jgi:hypothetical protein
MIAWTGLQRRTQAMLIFSLALAVRLAFTSVYSRGPGELIGDALGYHSYATSLLDHGRYEDATGQLASRMPGYPGFLAACYTIFGRQVLPVQLIQCLFGAGACVLIFLLASRWFDWPWALAGGLYAAIYYDLFSPCPRLLTETLSTFLIALIFWLWDPDRPPAARKALFLSMALAASFTLRPETLPFTALLAALILIIPNAPPARRLKAAALLCLASVAFAVPWAMRNRSVLGRVIVSSTGSGRNLYEVGIPLTVQNRLGGWPGYAVPPENLGEIGRMDASKAAARDFFHKARWTLLARAVVFNLAIQFYPFLPEYDPTLAFLIPFWIFGVWLCRKDRRFLPLLALLTYRVSLHCVVGVMESRYRQLLSPALILLAAVGLEGLQKKAGRKVFQRVVTTWAAFNLAVWALAPYFRQAALWIKEALT